MGLLPPVTGVCGPPILHPELVLTTLEMIPVRGLAEPFLLGRPPAGFDAGGPRAIALALAHPWVGAKTPAAVFTFPILLFFGF